MRRSIDCPAAGSYCICQLVSARASRRCARHASSCATPPAAGHDPDNSRIVSIGGAITEILYALGLEQRVVAVDSHELLPAAGAAEKPNVGYMRALSPEGVLGLNPSLILATEGAGPKEAIAVLRRRSVPSCWCRTSFTGEGILEKIRDRRRGGGQSTGAAPASPRRSPPISTRLARCAAAGRAPAARRCSCSRS